MKLTYLITAIAAVSLSACKTMETPHGDPAPVDAASRVVTTDADRKLMTDDCLTDRGKNAESCACTVEAAQTVFSQAEFDEQLNAIKTGVELPPKQIDFDNMTEEEEAVLDRQMTAFGACYQKTNDKIWLDACYASGTEQGVCNCISRGMESQVSDSDYASVIAAVTAGNDATSANAASYTALNATCTANPGTSFDLEEY